MECRVRNHKRAVRFSLDKLRHSPISTLLIIAVIGISMALPAGLYVIIKNLNAVAAGWDNAAQLSLFLKSETGMEAAEQLAARLRGRSDVAQVELITPQQALEEFRLSSGFGKALDALGENPLPAVLVVSPTFKAPNERSVEALASELERLPEVDRAQSDLEWLRRFYGILTVLSKSSALIALLLASAVLLVVGNTIRLEIENRREEIEVSKLIGASDSYVRRPFLYGGFWYGLLGGLTAWMILAPVLGRLEEPVQHLAGLYNSPYRLLGLEFFDVSLMILISVFLGLAGSWMALFWHLKDIEPR